MDSEKCFIASEGIPKICVPIVEREQDDIMEMVQQATVGAADFVEWRVDFYREGSVPEKVVQTACLLKSILGSMPLLVTFRSAAEGGECEISFEEYQDLLLAVAESGSANLIDVEMFRGYDGQAAKTPFVFDRDDVCNEKIRRLTDELKRNVTVIGSYHDFHQTPGREEIVARLRFMAELGADIPKIAVMPQGEEDVLCLLQATMQAKEELAVPVITMSMGGTGLISRLHGEQFGSAVTFGCMGKASAPGQIEVSVLRDILEVLHANGTGGG